MRIAVVGQALPKNYYDQETLIAALRRHWATRHHNVERLESLHRNVLVGGRHLALTLSEYERLESFGDANDAYIRSAIDLGAEALTRGLSAAGLAPAEVAHLFFVSTTGVAAPSIDARLANRIGLQPHLKRTPLFGLGCAGGAAGVARVADYLRGFPEEVAVLVAVELCSLTLQRRDLSIPNIIASGLFGDGAAAVVMVGENRPASGPRVIATRSVFYPATEQVMGWKVSGEGFSVVLSAEIPDVVRKHMRRDVDGFLADQGLGREQITTYVCHPGGPKVLEAFQEALSVPRDALAVTWDCLNRVGNLSSVSVLLVLEETMRARQPPPGSYGLMLALGPGFCSELVLLRW
jgi:alkylresorcinol/alkylpyrone synthase